MRAAQADSWRNGLSGWGIGGERIAKLRDNVEFTSSKTGRLTRGFVTKIAIKYVTVNTGQGLWRVPANMLSPVFEAEYA